MAKFDTELQQSSQQSRRSQRRSFGLSVRAAHVLDELPQDVLACELATA
jgi:hypothetical protein